MTCDHCVNGLRPLEWTDARPGDPQDFAVCLCDAGQAMRKATNEGRATVPLWHVWCAREQVDLSRVFLLEYVFTADELTAAGLRKAPTPSSREAALLAQGRKVKK